MAGEQGIVAKAAKELADRGLAGVAIGALVLVGIGGWQDNALRQEQLRATYDLKAAIETLASAVGGFETQGNAAIEVAAKERREILTAISSSCACSRRN